ncbi:response regulator transcription factor [Dysgonomonas sp. 521]|uniref:response regulator transcription factor n=1 Tax=Dysgonomonas sp. 521 TaxID=2302932 RepID=UPI00210692E7|nr:helix-turn-helix transcriptional regulator [Dysgonomonas sp. 521]
MTFEELRKEFIIKDSDIKPELLDDYMKVFDSFSRTTQLSFYVIDAHKKRFIYVSDNPLFLSGYTRQEVLDMGYDFGKKVVSEEDQKRVSLFNWQVFNIFHSYPVETRLKMSFSFDYSLIQPDKRSILINHKMTPICLSDSGQLWLALCVVTLSTKTAPGAITIMLDGEPLDFNFYSGTYKMIKKEVVSLSRREKEVLQLSAQGNSNEQIAAKLFIDINTVKFHKRNIFSKLDVKNITEAITFAQNNGTL